MNRALAILCALLLPLPTLGMTSVVFSANPSSSGSVSNTATRFIPCGANGGISGLAPNAADTAVNSVIPVAGSFANLRVQIATTTTVGSYTFTLYKNSVATTLSTTLGTGVQTNADTTHTVSFSPGDACAIAVIPSGTPESATTLYRVGMTFDGDDPTASLILFTGLSMSASAYSYWSPGIVRAGSASEPTHVVVFPTSGTISDLYILTSGDPGTLGSGKGFTITARVGLATTTISCVVQDTTRTCNSSNSIAVSAGQEFSIVSVPTATPTSVHAYGGFKFTPDTPGESLMFSAANGAWTSNGPRYPYIGGAFNNAGTTAEPDNIQAVAPVAFEWRKLMTALNSAYTAGNGRLWAGRINQATTSLTATILGPTATTSRDVVNSVSVVAGDKLNWITNAVNTPSGLPFPRISAVAYIAPPATLTEQIIGLVRSFFID